jgi:Asp-tRNA(Asn)/Glu-tRNA(Gln) amidotransferase B subunit
LSRAFFTDAINALSCYKFPPKQGLENDCIVSQKGLAQIVDYKELDGIVSAVLEQLSDDFEKYRSVKKKRFVFLSAVS